MKIDNLCYSILLRSQFLPIILLSYFPNMLTKNQLRGIKDWVHQKYTNNHYICMVVSLFQFEVSISDLNSMKVGHYLLI